MKIGILTFHGSHNYGAMLQAYATQRFLKSKTGGDVKIIDYRPDAIINSYKILSSPHGLKETLKFCIRLLKYRSLKKRWQGFEAFYEKQFDKTRPYPSYDSLASNPPDCDVVIVGSDQVFNPQNKNKKVYYLDFLADSKARLAAYAPSFGYADIPDHRKNDIRTSLDRIEFLSAREQEGCAIIKELTGRTVDCVLDPVFLLTPEEWVISMDYPFRMPFPSYILVYALVGVKEQMAIARQIRRHLKLPIVLIPGRNGPPFLSAADRKMGGACPEHFVHLFANADFVVTDSFHGTCFSVIFNKPFFSTIVVHATSARITSFLDRTGLTERALFSSRTIQKSELLLDFRVPNRLLRHEVSLSIQYLEQITSIGAS